MNCVAIICGGILGASIGRRVPERLTRYLPDTFGLSAMLMGIYLMQNTEQLAAVVLALIVGAATGELLQLESRLTSGLCTIGTKFPAISRGDHASELISLIVLFCFSGTGIFGAMNEAMTGDHTILLSKSILDFFTALIFGTSLGSIVALVAIPQSAIGLALFVCSSHIMPMISTVMMADFKGYGGVITLATGLKILRIKEFRIFNMLPGLIWIFLFSALFSMLPS